MARKRSLKPTAARQPIVQDFDLWTRLKQTVTPLDPKRIDDDHWPNTAAPATTDKPAPTRRSPKDPSRPVEIAAKPPVSALPLVTPALTGLDRRTSQRLARGQVEVDARIDLHGESVETARAKLKDFLINSRARGARIVLVITGKGSSEFANHTLHGRTHFHAPERQGRLRRMATLWFHDAEFSHLISGFQPAHPKHGGGGAFYVRMRRADRARKSQ